MTRSTVIASLSVLLLAGLAATSGAGDQPAGAGATYIEVVVPGGATLWAVAAAYSDGDIPTMVELIRQANNLKGYDIGAGARLRVPLQ